MSEWSLLTTHGLVLLAVADKPEVTTREIANNLGMAERSVQRAVSDLDSTGYIRRKKVGRRNKYQVNGKKPLRCPIKQDKSVDNLLAELTGSS